LIRFIRVPGSLGLLAFQTGWRAFAIPPICEGKRQRELQ
jgi:hypothetical protein